MSKTAVAFYKHVNNPLNQQVLEQAQPIIEVTQRGVSIAFGTNGSANVSEARLEGLNDTGGYYKFGAAGTKDFVEPGVYRVVVIVTNTAWSLNDEASVTITYD